MPVARQRVSHRALTRRGIPGRWWASVPALGILWAGGLHASSSQSLLAPHVAAGGSTGIGTTQWHVAAHRGHSPTSTAPRAVTAPIGVQMSRTDPDARPTLAEAIWEVGHTVLADAYGMNADLLGTCLSCTAAQAGPDSSHAEAREFRLVGEPVSEGQVPAGGYSSGALLVLPQNGLLQLAIAAWDGSATRNRHSSHAHARGALLEFAAADGRVATVTVGESSSDARNSNRTSRGNSQSSGLRAGLMSGHLALVLLHSESSSDSPGRVSIASVNGAETVPSGVANGDHRIGVPGATSVALLHSDGASALIGAAADGRSQRMVGIGSTRVGRPGTEPQPLT